ncbi:hypothetical protein VPH35_078234 [Triticum aestivum]
MTRRAAEEELEAEFNRRLAREAGFARVPLLLNERFATVILDSVADFVFADVGVPVPPDSDKSERFQDLVNVIFETPNPLEELANVAVNDSHGAPEDIADVVKDINDGMYSLNVDDGDGSLQLSVTQSQSVDGTEPVTQAEDVPMQLQLKDERIRKKKCDFQRRKELERRQKVACVQRSDGDVAQAPKGVGDEGGDAAFSTVDAGPHGSDMPVKTNPMQTRLTQVFTRDAVKEKKVVLKRKMLDRNPDGTQRRNPRVKAGSQPGNSKADGDSVAVKIGPSTVGGSPVRRSPRVLTNKKPSSSPLPERSLLKENKKRKVAPAKVNKGVKKRARVEAEDVVSEEDDIEVDSEDEFAVVVLPGAAPRVSREAAMFEGLVIEDMANMDYCQLMVDELRRAVVRYQDGVTMGKAITGCAIGPVLMYLDCLIRGKTAEPDMQIKHDEAAATDSRAGDGTEANISDHHTNDVGLEPPVVDIEQDEAAATDSRANDGTEANVSDHHTNDVGLERPVVDETSHNVEAVVERGVNDRPTDKCKGPVVGDEPCSPIGDVPLNVSSSKINDVVVNAAKVTDVEREAVVSGGDDARGVPLSSGRDVGTKVADEDVGAASILDAKSSGVGIAGNENLSDCEDFPPENFPPGGLDYGDALQDASSMEEVPSEDDDLLLSISSGPLT